LRMTPGQEQDLEVKLTNTSDKDITIFCSANTATTNSNGVVLYDGSDTKKDSSLQFGLSDLATVQQEIRLAANSNQVIKVHLKMPDKEFEGTVLGGLYFKEKIDDVSEKSESMINNRFAYSVGVVITENDAVVEPDLKLTKVEPGLENGRTTVYANIQNFKAAMLKDLSMSGEVYEKAENKPSFVTEKKDLKMAPNSNFDFAVSLDNAALKSGDYTFEGVATSGEKTWKFKKDFTIKAEDAKKLNSNAVELKEEENNSMQLFLIVVIAAFSIIILILIILLKRKQNS